MKVAMMKEWKRYFTVIESENAKEIIRQCKEDEISVADYAMMAARVAMGACTPEILKCSAEVVKNSNTEYDRWFEGSGHLDVYIKFYAFDLYKGFYSCGICLSHIWDITGDNTDDIKNMMYIRKYEKVD